MALVYESYSSGHLNFTDPSPVYIDMRGHDKTYLFQGEWHAAANDVSSSQIFNPTRTHIEKVHFDRQSQRQVSICLNCGREC